jgi:hypothetical protein
LAYFLTDFYEKLYDDSLNIITTQQSVTSSLLSTTSPTILSTTTPPKPLVSTSASSTNHSSPPIVLKISTKKIEIISSIKTLIVENELCSVLYIYLIVACLEINDWVNLKVLLPAIRYPNNNSVFFEKWFLFQVFNYLAEKNIAEQFKHDWFVTMIFDEFLFLIVKQKDDMLQIQDQNASAVNPFYDQVHRLIEKIYPAHMSAASFTRVVECLKPKKFVNLIAQLFPKFQIECTQILLFFFYFKKHSSSMHISYLKLKSRLEQDNDPTSNK